MPALKAHTGSAFVAKPLKVWNGSAWVTKPLKVWDGSAWVAAGGDPVAPVFLDRQSTPYTANQTVTGIPKPAGTALNTIVLLGIFLGTGGTTPVDPTPPAGFTQIGPYLLPAAGGFFAKFGLFWKRATASEPALYDFTTTNGYSTQGVSLGYNGCPTAGSPVDAFSTAEGTTVDSVGASVTTTQANDMLVLVNHNWDASGSLLPPDGMVERFDSLLYAADQVIAAAGATGTRSQTNVGANPWSAFMVALKGS